MQGQEDEKSQNLTLTTCLLQLLGLFGTCHFQQAAASPVNSGVHLSIFLGIFIFEIKILGLFKTIAQPETSRNWNGDR